MCKLFGVQEVKGDQTGMRDIEPVDKSAAPYGYGMPMMNTLGRRLTTDFRSH
jgi:hypothetical protein